MLAYLNQLGYPFTDVLWTYQIVNKRSKTNLLISARPQRQTNAKGCRIFGDLDQLKSKDTKKKQNSRLIPTAKRGKEIKQQ